MGSRGSFEGASVVITGAGSGIGRALALEFGRRGAVVVATDIDASAAAEVARAIGGTATSQALDVRDAAAVQRVCDETAEAHGRLDVIVNNAGIGVGGEVQSLTLAHWERVLDINVRGVIHGVHAAYPRMVRQRSGQIVNVASLAGLGPAPLLVPYGMSKHAVVGLSTALRIEAKAHGVKVNVLCPAAIETPLLDSDNPSDLPGTPWRPDMRRFLTRLAGPPYPVERFAKAAVDALARNLGVFVAPARARAAWRMGRWMPGLVEKLAGDAVDAERASQKALPGPR